MRHLLTLVDLGTDKDRCQRLRALLDEAARLKADSVRGVRPPLLAGRVLGMVFEKPSLRTRASFEAGMVQLGGSSIFLSASDGAIGQREPVADFARTLCHYVDGVVLRVFEHATLTEFAAHSTVPVINGLSDLFHPCQALGDLLTLQEEFGPDLAGRTLVFVGDGNNVARSLALGCGLLGIRFVLAAPRGYGFDDIYRELHRRVAPKGELYEAHDPYAAVVEADVVYTDVWTSMGQENERDERRKHFAPFQVNSALLARAPAHARVMHCLPAKRGEEITADAIEGERSLVFPQAGNRMHAQKALLVWLLGKKTD